MVEEDKIWEHFLSNTDFGGGQRLEKNELLLDMLVLSNSDEK
jgi:hypothetical protein